MEGLVADLRIHDNRRVVAIVDELYRKRSAIQQVLETKVPGIRDSIFSTFKQLLREFDSRGYRN
jgi:flagellar basal body-associated protein FliL